MGIIRISDEESIKLWQEKGAAFMKELSPEYRNGYAFVEELSDSKQDILEADTESEKREAEKRYNELKSMVTEAECVTLFLAFRSGLNIHCQHHLIPEPHMLVWFEDTGQKRVIPDVDEDRNLFIEDGIIIPNMRDCEYAVFPGGFIRSYATREEYYFVLNGQEYLYTHFSTSSGSYACLTNIYTNTGFETYTFSGKCLDYGLEAADYSLYPHESLYLTGNRNIAEIGRLSLAGRNGFETFFSRGIWGKRWGSKLHPFGEASSKRDCQAPKILS